MTEQHKFAQLNPDLKTFLQSFFDLMNEYDRLSTQISNHLFDKLHIADSEYQSVQAQIKQIDAKMVENFFGGNKEAWNKFNIETRDPPHFQNYDKFWIKEFKRSTNICMKIWKQDVPKGMSPLAFSIKKSSNSYVVEKWNYRTAVKMIEGDQEFPMPDYRPKTQDNPSFIDKMLYGIFGKKDKNLL